MIFFIHPSSSCFTQWCHEASSSRSHTGQMRWTGIHIISFILKILCWDVKPRICRSQCVCPRGAISQSHTLWQPKWKHWPAGWTRPIIEMFHSRPKWSADSCRDVQRPAEQPLHRQTLLSSHREWGSWIKCSATHGSLFKSVLKTDIQPPIKTDEIQPSNPVTEGGAGPVFTQRLSASFHIVRLSYRRSERLLCIISQLWV